MIGKKCVASVILLLSSVAAQAELLTIQGASSIYDCAIGGSYDDKDAWGANTLWIREYWNNDYQGFGAYDYHAFVRVDLSAIPAGAVIDSASFNIKVAEAYNPSTDPRTMSLWAVSPFTENVTMMTYDGTNAWPDGKFDGVDGYRVTPLEKLLASATVDSSLNGTYLEFADDFIPLLTDYIQYQSNQSAGQRYAYFELTWNDDSADYWCGLYSTDSAGNEPYMSISYSVPEPISLTMLGLGVAGLVLRKRW